jgi:hypothetical protein
MTVEDLEGMGGLALSKDELSTLLLLLSICLIIVAFMVLHDMMPSGDDEQ